MLTAYKTANANLDPAPDDIAGAIWIDLMDPSAGETALVADLGIDVPSLSDMQEIELSNRLYHDDSAHYMTVVLPGTTRSGGRGAGPVSFILTESRLVTVRHHAPRPFETFPTRADHTAAGCASPAHLFLGLSEEIVGRLADLLEEAGGALDSASRRIFNGDSGAEARILRHTLQEVGAQGEVLNRVKLAMLTMERALSYYTTLPGSKDTRKLAEAALRDLRSLSDHADFLSSRVGLVVDATMGMINLAQNDTVRIFSIVAVLFMPPTLVASIYGMNFRDMPELAAPWGYPLALLAMVLSAALTYALFKWRKWL